jgi:hypothetical protein
VPASARRTATRVAATACLLALAWPGAARAHTRSATFGDVVVAGRDVTWTLRVRVVDLIGTTVGAGLSAGADVPAALARAPQIEDKLARGLGVMADGAPCDIVARGLDADAAAEPTIAAWFRFACARDASTLRYDLFFDADALHSGYTKLSVAGGDATTFVFRARARALALAAPRSIWRSARAYLVLGVEHIFTGYDHLAFLAALLLATGLARRSGARGPAIANEPRVALREVLKIVTAFTSAHSITLIVSTLHPGLLGTRWVEPAIAASIAFVGVENLLPRTPRHRWLVVFAFGLVHGLGFSSVLREIGLPARGLVLSLLAFNLGVELGQLAVVALVLPIVLGFARRRPEAFERWGLRGASAAIALAGGIWLVLRLRT